MKLITVLVGVLIALSFIVMVLFVIFGQVTVRKLRKIPQTKHDLGFEFMSGWNIINVAQALALPKIIIRKLNNSPLGVLYADASKLYKHTNTFDRVLAAVFYWLLMFSGLFGITLVLLNAMSVFD